jgi:hypothetical protein
VASASRWIGPALESHSPWGYVFGLVAIAVQDTQVTSSWAALRSLTRGAWPILGLPAMRSEGM